MNKERKQQKPYGEDFYIEIAKHKPTTGIIEQINKILKSGAVDIIRNVTIDVATALDLLTLNKGNRNASFINIQRYASDMLNSKWKDHVDPFVITSDGRLRNGQKRSIAVLSVNEQENFSFVTDIFVGLPPDVAPVLDTGQVRSLADALKDKGFTDVNVLAAAIRTIYYLENFQRMGGSLDRTEKMRNDQIDIWTNNRKNTQLVQKLISNTTPFRKEMKFFAVSGFVALWYWLHKRDAETAEYFMTKLATGADLNTQRIIDENIHIVRNRLVVLDRDPKERFSSGRQDERYRLVVYAWNKSRKGERIGSVGKLKPDFESPNIEKPI